MKKIPSIAPRKHGARALARLARECDPREAALPADRLTTTLTFETNTQAYLWITDRGRSRLIKH